LAAESAVRAVVVVDDLAFEESVELFGVDAVGSLHFAVEPWRAGFDLDVVDAFVEQVPVEGAAGWSGLSSRRCRRPRSGGASRSSTAG
jgi:hypothetical protein